MAFLKSVKDFFSSFTEDPAVSELREACLHLEARIESLFQDPEQTDPAVVAPPQVPVKDEFGDGSEEN